MAGSTFSMIGSAKAAVLPEPVCDCPMTSPALQENGDGGGLNRRGLLVPHFRDGFEQIR